MKRIALVALIAVVAVACGRNTVPPQPAGGGDQVDARKIAIYEAALRALYGTEGWYDPVYIDERICGDFGDPMTEIGAHRCEATFTPAEQKALLTQLSDLPHVRFTSDWEGITRRIFKGEIEGAGLLSVGPIDGDGDRVQIPGSAYCGGLCGHWMTMVIERSGDAWTFTGTTGGVAIA